MKYTIQEFTSTIEIRKSKFIAYLCPYNHFNQLIERLKIEHPKARHFVYAYRFLNDFDQIVENSSDDGEPKGTSGRPSLKVLHGADIINSAVVVVRYFGGTLLGTGGLVKAYSDAVNSVIEIAEFFAYEKKEEKKVVVAYKDLAKVEHTLKALQIEIEKKEFGDNVTMNIRGKKEQLSQFHYEKDLVK